jgi:D-3-phosphoglycerate dehydrogenase
MHRLAGRVLGLVGLGRIARALVPKARILGLDVIAHTPSGNSYATGCRMVSLDELLETSDFISLHLPLNESSRHLLGPREFVRMKPSAWVINTSRGALIDHEALWFALQQEQLAGAALDVFDPEPPDLSLPLFQDERVIATPHAGFLSDESLVELRTRTARQVAQALQGLRPEHVVNPQVYEGIGSGE